MKKCGKCKIIKEDIAFSNCQFKRSGGICRLCNTEIIKKYKENNLDKIKEYQHKYDLSYYQDNKSKILNQKKKYYESNKDKILEDRKEYYSDHKSEKREYNQQYYVDNKKTIINSAKQYAIKNKTKIKDYQNQYLKERRSTDLNFKLKCNISANINFHLKSNGFSKNRKSTIKYLEYSIEELKNHLEKQFEPWMTWNNYGKYSPKTWKDDDQSTWAWQIDHIIPHSTFKYNSMNDDEFKKCWSLDNLRPYSAKQNFVDGVNKIRH